MRFIATPRMVAGECLTSKRCSMTRHYLPCSTRRHTKQRGMRSTPMWRVTSSTLYCGKCTAQKASSALDADSPLHTDALELGEGVFYVWTSDEIERVLGKETASIFDFRYGV